MLRIPNSLGCPKQQRRFIYGFRREKLLHWLLSCCLAKSLFCAFGIALQEIGIMHALRGFEFRAGKAQPLDGRLVVIEDALQRSWQCGLVNRALKPGAEAFRRLMLPDDLASCPQENPGLG